MIRLSEENEKIYDEDIEKPRSNIEIPIVATAIFPQCVKCSHFIADPRGYFKCEVYPEEIPKNYRRNEDVCPDKK